MQSCTYLGTCLHWTTEWWDEFCKCLCANLQRWCRDVVERWRFCLHWPNDIHDFIKCQQLDVSESSVNMSDIWLQRVMAALAEPLWYRGLNLSNFVKEECGKLTRQSLVLIWWSNNPWLCLMKCAANCWPTSMRVVRGATHLSVGNVVFWATSGMPAPFKLTTMSFGIDCSYW